MLKHSVHRRAWARVRVLRCVLLPRREALVQPWRLAWPLFLFARRGVFVTLVAKVNGLRVTSWHLINLLNIHVVSVQLLHFGSSGVLIYLVRLCVFISVLGEGVFIFLAIITVFASLAFLFLYLLYRASTLRLVFLCKLAARPDRFLGRT